MPTVRRSRLLKAPVQEVYELVADPHHMPRWWPGLQGMEGIEDDVFTQVFMTKKGRRVRADHYLVELEPPGPAGQPGKVAWAQSIEGTPFERVLSEAVTEVEVSPAQEGSEVTISQTQTLRGANRTGGFLLRRATRHKLDEALDGLERVLGLGRLSPGPLFEPGERPLEHDCPRFLGAPLCLQRDQELAVMRGVRGKLPLGLKLSVGAHRRVHEPEQMAVRR